MLSLTKDISLYYREAIKESWRTAGCDGQMRLRWKGEVQMVSAAEGKQESYDVDAGTALTSISCGRCDSVRGAPWTSPKARRSPFDVKGSRLDWQ
jgi:hypothetical protein